MKWAACLFAYSLEFEGSMIRRLKLWAYVLRNISEIIVVVLLYEKG